MNQVIVVCGNWMFERKRWQFVSDNRGTRSIPATDRTPFTSFQRMVFEDFGVDSQKFDVQLSYMLPKKVLEKFRKGTPPVVVDNSRQFLSFLNHCKDEAMQLYVEVKNKDDNDDGEDIGKVELKGRRRQSDEYYEESDKVFFNLQDDVNRPNADVETGIGNRKRTMKERDDNDEVDQEVDSDDDYRFDYCDDTDGVTSDEEDFTVYGRSHLQEEDSPKMSSKKKISEPTNQDSQVPKECMQVDRNSLSLAVGQRYESREDLVRRLKILTVLDKFDFDVDRSKPDLLIVKCWVQGCTWRLRASPVGDSLKFDIRLYVGEHTCSVTERSARSRQATPDILGLLYKNVILAHGSIDKSVLPKQVAQSLNAKFGIQVNVFFITTKYY